MDPVLILSILLAVISDAAYVVIIGILLSSLWLNAVDAESPPDSVSANQAFPAHLQRRLLLTSVAILIAAHLVRPWVVAAGMSGSSRFTEVLALVPTVLSSTHQGKLWYINSISLAALLIAALFSAVRVRPVLIWIVFASLFAIAFTKAASGHAADEGDFTLAEFAQCLHILSTAVWAGSVLVSGIIVVPRLARLDSAILWRYGNRLSKVVTWALLALLVSGIYTSDKQVNGSLHILWTSSWGKVLFAKVAFVLVAILLGSFSRFGHLKAPATPPKAALFAHTLRAEAIAMLFILCLSGLLANTPPPMGIT